MRYYPVKIQRIISVQYKKLKPGEQAVNRTDTIPTTERRNGSTFGYTGVQKEFFRVVSKLLGECGHEHKTEASAQPCFKRMKKEWSAIRSNQSKTAYARRQQVAQA